MGHMAACEESGKFVEQLKAYGLGPINTSFEDLERVPTPESPPYIYKKILLSSKVLLSFSFEFHSIHWLNVLFYLALVYFYFHFFLTQSIPLIRFNGI